MCESSCRAVNICELLQREEPRVFLRLGTTSRVSKPGTICCSAQEKETMATLRLAYGSSIMGRNIARASFGASQPAKTVLWSSLRGGVPHAKWNRLHTPLSLTLSLRKLSSSAVETAAKEQSKQQSKGRSYWWYRFAAMVRYIRIPALVLGVYSLGYQQGIMDCTKTPKMLQDKILDTILVGQGVTDTSHVKVVGEREISKFSGERHNHVALVGQRIILAAREHVQAKLSESMEKVRAKLPEDMAENLLQSHYAKDKDCLYWYEAGLRLLGENEQERPWQYIFIQTAMPNAFVTEMLPQRFFITTGLLEMADSADGTYRYVVPRTSDTRKRSPSSLDAMPLCPYRDCFCPGSRNFASGAWSCQPGEPHGDHAAHCGSPLVIG